MDDRTQTLPTSEARAEGGATMPWGFSTLGCVDLGLEPVCALARRFGVHHLEIRGLGGTLDAPAYFGEHFSDPAGIRRLLDRYQQRIVMLDTSFKLIGSEAPDRQALADYAGWAEALKVPYLRVFGGGSKKEPIGKERMREAVDNLKWWEEQKAGAGWEVDLLLETHHGFSSSEHCLDLHEKSPAGLGMVWDTHHTWREGEKVEDSWARIGHLVRHVHIKDGVSVPSARHDYTYVLPGSGEFPAGDTLQILSAAAYSGVISLEWERKWHPDLPPLEEALKACRTAGWR